jgi:hypothetical protein
VGFGSLLESATDVGDQRLAIKVSYWLPLH